MRESKEVSNCHSFCQCLSILFTLALPKCHTWQLNFPNSGQSTTFCIKKRLFNFSLSFICVNIHSNLHSESCISFTVIEGSLFKNPPKTLETNLSEYFGPLVNFTSSRCAPFSARPLQIRTGEKRSCIESNLSKKISIQSPLNM